MVLDRGAAQRYAVQRDLPAAMHALAERASAAPGGGAAPLALISYSPAFPFFELWAPAHRDLVRLAAVQVNTTPRYL
jgi:hypothetical protein